MKRQQVISRFFATKPASGHNVSLSEGKIIHSPVGKLLPAPSVKTAATVAWPPHSRLGQSLQCGSSPLRSKKRAIDDISAEGIPSSAYDDGGNLESHTRKKRTRSGRTASKVLLDIAEAEQGTQPLQCQTEFAVDCIDKESLLSESNTGLLPTDDPSEEGSDSPDANSDVLLGCKPSSREDNSRQSEIFASSIQLAGNAKDNKALTIPVSDPVRHKRFVEKVLARTEDNGEVKKAWYGTPPTGKEKLTPLELQVVELKAKYPDVLLMVEVGYKYRFFGDDAEIATKVLRIFAHYDHSFLTASIPTFRLHVHVRRLVAAGYKVGVVRQTETAAIKAHGSNKTGPFTRGLSALYTKATLEAAEDLGGGTEGQSSDLSSYLMCIAEKPIPTKAVKKQKMGTFGRETQEPEKDAGTRNGCYDTEFGVVAVETATGDVMFGNFKDTVMRTELEGHLLTCSPAELLLASPLSSTTDKLLLDFAGPAAHVRVERVSRDCFKDGGALAEVLDFYGNKAECEHFDADVSKEEKVNGLEVVMAMPDIVVQALALALRYLQQFNLEKVLRLGAVFRPFSSQNEMNLSPNSLYQLEILRNNSDGSENGSLLWLMDHTKTAFGARLLRHWVTHPLCDRTLITARLDAVTEIAGSMGSLGLLQIEGTYPGSGKGGGLVGRASRGRSGTSSSSLQQGLLGGLLSTLGRMPDLERGVTRIFHRTATVQEFVSVIQALLTSAKHFQQWRFREEEAGCLTGNGEGEFKRISSSLLQRLITAVSSPMISDHATHLLSALNTDAASSGDKLNLFNCRDGRFPEVAKWRIAIKAAEKELDGYLPGFRKRLRHPKLNYMSINGVSYLVEVPVAQSVPADWLKVNGTKKVDRYHPPEVLESIDKLALAKEELAAACTRAWDTFLAEFSAYYVDFRASVQALAALDCLHALAVLSRNQGYTRPEFVEESDASQLMIQLGRHPMLDSMLQDGFVPNDTFLGGSNERCQIITGPNMGGKSCYIRQVALIAIMAQVGSYIPASCAKLHVLDSVHTRMGASDTLQKGSSTFFEELSETSAILRSATSRSLVIVDELGRGTSTHDGVAIAYATLQHLLKETQCLTLFVTHYPKIVELKDEFPGQVGPYYVSYITHELAVSTELAITRSESPGNSTQSSQDVSEAAQEITFLYKMVPGIASRSFGLHVARLAQIPGMCIVRAVFMAAKMEKEVNDRTHFKATALCDVDVASDAKNDGDRGDDSGHIQDRVVASKSRHIEDNYVGSDSEPTCSRQTSCLIDSKNGAALVEVHGCNGSIEDPKGESGVGDLVLLLRNALTHTDTENYVPLLRDIQLRVKAAIL